MRPKSGSQARADLHLRRTSAARRIRPSEPEQHAVSHSNTTAAFAPGRSAGSSGRATHAWNGA
jgi:hypothetical protein